MKTVPISGTLQSVTFFEDDTIETVRQRVALAVGSHPDRLFLTVNASLPKEYYSTNPVHWSALFFRLSFDGKTIPVESLRTYTSQIRPGLGVAEAEIPKEEWDSVSERLRPMFAPEEDFQEWRVLGVDESKSFCLPLPPRDLPGLQAGSRPVPQVQSLFETLHPYETTEIRAEVVPEGAAPSILLNYYPRLRPETPISVEPLRDAIEAQHTQLKALLELDTPKHETVSVVRAKWYIPLLSSHIIPPRARIEQMFYGMTVSPTTPYVGFFTAKTESTRHKFYCKDPKTKTPTLDIPMWKSWTSLTIPQRRVPTLLLYRGTSRLVFDRIAITSRDIVVNVRRDKESRESLEELKASVLAWVQSLDALEPFLAKSDIDSSRWELSDLSVLATYSREIREFDLLRFPCLQSLFGVQGDTFRLLRAEHTSDEISPQELQALQVLGQEDAERTPNYLATELGIPLADAEALFARVLEQAEDLNLERSLKAYPVLKFSAKEVILKFVTDLERTLRYADILRHVLTSDADAVDAICPKRMERVGAVVAVPQQELALEDAFAVDEDFNALLDFGEEEAAPQPAAAAAAAPAKDRRLKVGSRVVGTYNYFNTRLQDFDAATFDKSIYPSKCDKLRQVVVLTPEQKARVGPEYDFSTATEQERLELADPEGTAICPPYWCMRDEIPLREDQLVVKEDGLQHCPMCNGKVRTSEVMDIVEFPVIKRDGGAKFPDVLKAESSSTINRRRIPCCFQTPRSAAEVLSPKEDVAYILSSDTQTVPPLRMAYLSEDLAGRLGSETRYATSVKKGRLAVGEADIFRVGLGRPSKTLPTLLQDKTVILPPRDAKDRLLRCSFFRTWKGREAGETEVDRIVASIDAAYKRGGLSLLEELEYVTTFLKCEVIRVDPDTNQVVCGFWSEAGAAVLRTVVLVGTTLLVQVSRVKAGKSYTTMFQGDLRKAPFADKTLGILRDRHSRACSINVPILSDAIAELMASGKAMYQVILDPFRRIQAVLVPGDVLLPIQPTHTDPDAGVVARNGYGDIRDDELPRLETLRPFLAATRHDLFKLRAELANVEGVIVEVELASGFRVPVQPMIGEEGIDAKEVVQTIRRRGDEQVLVEGRPNAEDIAIAQSVTYSSEIYEFLLFSLSKHIATDSSGEVLDGDYAKLRRAIEERSPTLLRELTAWFKLEAYPDATKSPIEFVNKVRAPCGQFTTKDACNKSSLCGWHKDTCKIRVKPIVEPPVVLKRIAKTLVTNDKQRALVLDGRMSPFFSTVLYLEMPHEWITTTV